MDQIGGQTQEASDMSQRYSVVGLLDRPDPRTAGLLPVVVREGEWLRFLGSTPMWGHGCDAREWEGLVRDLLVVRFEGDFALELLEPPRRLVGVWVGEALRRAGEAWGVPLPSAPSGRVCREITRGEWGGRKLQEQVVGRVWFGEAREAVELRGAWCEAALGVVKARWRAGDAEGAREVALGMVCVSPNDARARAALWGTAKNRARMLACLARVGHVQVGAEEMCALFEG